MKKTLALITFFAGGSLSIFLLTLIGCGKSNYSILYKDIFTKVIRYQPNGFETPVAENDTCDASNFFLEAAFDVTEIASRPMSLPGNTAWAFQPGPRYYKPVEKIKGIRIFPLQRYNNNFPAGTDMSLSCRFISGTSYNEATDSSARSLIEDINDGYSSDGGGSSFHIYFPEKPETISGQQFSIELTTESEAKIRDTTIFFYLKP